MQIRLASERFRLRSGVVVVLQQPDSFPEGTFITLDQEALEPGISLPYEPIRFDDNLVEAPVKAPGNFSAVFSDVEVDIVGDVHRSRVCLLIDDLRITAEDIERAQVEYWLRHRTLLTIDVLDAAGTLVPGAVVHTSTGEGPTINLLAEAGSVAVLLEPGDYPFFLVGHRLPRALLAISAGDPPERSLVIHQ